MKGKDLIGLPYGFNYFHWEIKNDGRWHKAFNREL
jgi:hypothetical protein